MLRKLITLIMLAQIATEMNAQCMVTLSMM